MMKEDDNYWNTRFWSNTWWLSALLVGLSVMLMLIAEWYFVFSFVFFAVVHIVAFRKILKIKTENPYIR